MGGHHVAYELRRLENMRVQARVGELSVQVRIVKRSCLIARVCSRGNKLFEVVVVGEAAEGQEDEG